MKKLILVLFGLVGASFMAQAQLEKTVIYVAPPSGDVLVGGPTAVFTPAVYDQPVTYNAPVQYYAPVVYNAPVFYNTAPPASTGVDCMPPPCVDYPTTSVQVIPFGGGQARQQGYNFGARR